MTLTDARGGEGIEPSKREILGIDDQRGADQVAINGVPACTPSSLDFQQNPEVAMDAINVVTDARSPLLTE